MQLILCPEQFRKDMEETSFDMFEENRIMHELRYKLGFTPISSVNVENHRKLAILAMELRRYGFWHCQL